MRMWLLDNLLWFAKCLLGIFVPLKANIVLFKELPAGVPLRCIIYCMSLSYHFLID